MSTDQSVDKNPRERTAAEAALQPIAAEQRAFGWRDHASLWFVFGIGLLVIQAGTYLVPIAGTEQALFAVVIGSVVGAVVLAWTARLGCVSGLSSAGLMYCSFGRSFARLPIVLNVLQLIGWGTYELVILRDGTHVLGARLLDLGGNGALGTALLTIVWGAALAVLLSLPMVALVERVINRVVLPLVLLALLWLTWQVVASFVTAGPIALRPPEGSSGGLFAAIDVVAAFPVSWLPVVADYARHGKRTRGTGSGGAFTGTWTGYFIANAWGFALGVLVVSAAPLDSSLVAALALLQGGLAILALILLHELGNAYGSTYAAAASLGGVSARFGVRGYGVALAGLCTLLAIVLPIASMEPFLLLLSSIFVPLYGVILGRLGVSEGIEHAPRARAVDPTAVVLWIAGIALYQALGRWEPAWGSTLPTLVATFALGWLTRPRTPRLDSTR